MILEIFGLLVFLALALIYFGYYTNPPLRVYSIVGFVFLFILGSWVMLYQYMPSNFATAGLQYKSGSIINSTDATNVIITNVYSNYNDPSTFWVGFTLALMSAFSIWLVTAHDGGNL
jgi:hypothetical protein